MTDEKELQLALDYAQIDLQIDEWIRQLDEDIVSEYEFDEEDRAMLIYFMRLAYIKGYEDGATMVYERLAPEGDSDIVIGLAHTRLKDNYNGS